MPVIHNLFNDLANSLYFNTGANVIQWAGLLGYVWGMYALWHVSCDAHLWCWRPGRHAVTGTTWKTCSNHAQTHIHKRLRGEHDLKHPGRMKRKAVI